MESQVFYIVSAVLLGIVVGALIMYFLTGKGGNSAKSVAAVEEKLNKYQEDVVTHFEQTADLVDELTQSYKKVFDHLGQSARELLSDEQVKAQIEKRKDRKVTLGFLADETEVTVSEDLVEKAIETENLQQAETLTDESTDISEEITQEVDVKVEELIEEIDTEIKKQTAED